MAKKPLHVEALTHDAARRTNMSEPQELAGGATDGIGA